MYEGDLRELVTSPYTTFRGDSPVFILCPNHKDENTENLAVYSDHAFCYACRKWYGRKKFSELFDSLTQTKAKLYSSTHSHRAKPRSNVDLEAIADSSFQLLWKRLPAKRETLALRGIEEDVVYDYQLGHTGFAYVLPVFEGQKVVSLRYRRDDAITKEGPKYWGQAGFNDVRLYPFPLFGKTPWVVLTEGEFDALLLRRYGVNAYSFTNGGMAIPEDHELAELFKGYDRILLWRDQDPAGQEGTGRLMTAFTRLNKLCVRQWWDLEKGKDVTELWQNSRETFDKLVASYTELVSDYTYA